VLAQLLGRKCRPEVRVTFLQGPLDHSHRRGCQPIVRRLAPTARDKAPIAALAIGSNQPLHLPDLQIKQLASPPLLHLPIRDLPDHRKPITLLRAHRHNVPVHSSPRQSDAYHSLSIEGYRVSPELIERVRSGTWNPDADSADQKSRGALAARGYWQAFEKVKDTVAQIIGGADAGALVRSAHRDWYRELFQPCVVTGIIKPAALAGYRNSFIYIKGSRYVLPRSEVVPDDPQGNQRQRGHRSGARGG
jgi:hypothetical protein